VVSSPIQKAIPSIGQKRQSQLQTRKHVKWNERWPSNDSQEATYNGFFGIEWWELESQF